MIKNELPALQAPYKLDAGEGLRYAFGSHLATSIARSQELSQAAAGTILTGAKGTRFPNHRHGATHEALFVVEGAISLALDDKDYLLTPGDYVNIPPGTAHGYEFLDHRGRLLSWTFGGNAADAYAALGKPYAGTVYPESSKPIDWSSLDSSVDSEVVADRLAPHGSWTPKVVEHPIGDLLTGIDVPCGNLLEPVGAEQLAAKTG